MKFKVEYLVEKDMIPYMKVIWKMQYKSFGRKDLQERLLGNKPEGFQKDIKAAKTEEVAKKVISDFLNLKLRKNESQFLKRVSSIQAFLDKNQDKIISSLEKIYDNDFPFDEIGVYLTTAGICPYNYEKRWFMLYQNADENRAISVALHELNHFMFYYYYYSKLEKKGISNHKLEVLKESLVVYNPSDTDYKPQAEELKGFLITLKGKPMDEIIELAIKSEAFQKLQSE